MGADAIGAAEPDQAHETVAVRHVAVITAALVATEEIAGGYRTPLATGADRDDGIARGAGTGDDVAGGRRGAIGAHGATAGGEEEGEENDVDHDARPFLARAGSRSSRASSPATIHRSTSAASR